MAYSPAYDATGISFYSHPSLTFANGESRPFKLAYRLHGDLKSRKVALLPTCFGGVINTTYTFTNPPQGNESDDGALSSYLVIVVAMLGNGECSSPSSDSSFPSSLDYRDCINAQYALCRQHLKIDSLDAVIGFSMGGQQAYHWACMYPEYVRNVVVICGSAKTSEHNYAFLEGPKAALLNSIDYEDGKYGEKRVRPSRGLKAFGRAYAAWLTSGAWFRERCYQQLGFKNTEEAIKGIGEARYEHWDPADLLILASMWQAGDIGKVVKGNGGDYKKALQGIKARVLLMPARTDQYFAVEDNEEELKYLQHGELAVIETSWGHLAGAGPNEEDNKWMNDRIATFLAGGQDESPYQ